jgi:branched-chain amino acid transport system substrate-binding protein
VGQQIVRKLIDKDKVDAVAGLSFLNVLMGSLPLLAESSVVAIATNAELSPVAGGRSATPTSSRWRGRTTATL